MSFFRIRALRSFGDYHKVIENRPVFPDEKVEFSYGFEDFIKIDKRRKQRLWMYMEKEHIDRSVRRKAYNQVEGADLMRPLENQKPEKYYIERGLLDKADPFSEFFDVDRETLLPYNLGYDEVIKDLKEKRMAEASQDQIRDIWMKLGFMSTIDVLNSSKPVEMKESLEKINRKIYTDRHKKDPTPYEKIHLEENPRSQTNSLKDPEFFSDDELKDEDEYKKCLKMAKEKYKDRFLDQSDDDFSSDFDYQRSMSGKLNEDSDEPDIKNRKKKKDTKSNKKEKEFSKDFTYSPFFPYPMHEMMQSKAKRRRRTAIENAAKVAYENLKARAKPVFKIFSPRDYLLKGDLDHSLKMKKGFVPSFAEIIAEAEKFILNNPVLEKLNKQDEYEKNMHFVPKYLDKNLTPENYLFSFMPKVEDAVYPGYITEQYPLREDDHVLVELHDQAESIRSKGYVPDPKDMSLKVYSLVKNDPYHMHFLNNHIKFWNECIRETVESQNFEKEIRAKPAIPWEYIDVPQVPIIRPVRDRKVAPDSEGYISAPGKRKRSYAVASIRPGTGIISINGKNLLAYCPDHVSRERIVRPFTVTRLTGMYDVKARVRGGGVMGQSQAVQLAVARVIAKIHPDANPILHDSEVMRRDPRQVERKKTSKFKARKSYTYVKR